MTLKDDWVDGGLVSAADLNATAAQVNTNTTDIAGKVDKNTPVTGASKTNELGSDAAEFTYT